MRRENNKIVEEGIKKLRRENNKNVGEEGYKMKRERGKYNILRSVIKKMACLL